ncbi:MAG TPA: hypothetical protein VKB93_00100 [Thermoanaerobaculia bacterium]|nr:hypothetical protein [Thermoanaerobaculia bacterium]
MTLNRHVRSALVFSLAVIVTAAVPVLAQAKGLLSQDTNAAAALHDPRKPEVCRGAVSLVTDVGFEGIQTTTHNWSSATGGGESLRFDKTPVLSTKVELREGCLNAHFSAIVGSAQTYSVSPMTMFQVTLTPAGGGAPQHMYGHFETPFGIFGPSVIIEAEQDSDTFGANFFQRIGEGEGEVKPGTYIVDVWWSGGPTGAGGAIGAAFVLKLYQ